MKKFFLLLCILLMVSCHRDAGSIYDSFIVESEESVEYNSLLVDSVHLDHVNVSGVSHSTVGSDGCIYYYDQYFSWVYKFDTDGNLLGRYLGYGRGPKESTMKRSACFAESFDGHWALYGTSLEFELFDSDFSAINRFRIPYSRQSGVPESFFEYTFFPPSPEARLYEDKLYIKSYSSDDKFNYLTTNDLYLKEARHIAVVDMRTGEPPRMELRGFPSVYGNDTYKYASFELVHFDIANGGRFYVGFEADSLVYMFTDKFKPIKAFGRAGKNMDRDYEETRSAVEDRGAAVRNRQDKGYYSYIEYIDEVGICFRSYVKGKHSEYDGLQIYRDGVLIGDCEVPKGFKVTGYVAPYYYSQVYGENDGDKLYVYRFTL